MKRTHEESDSSYVESSDSDAEEVIENSDDEIDYNTNTVVIFPYKIAIGASASASVSMKPKKTKIDKQREDILNAIKKLNKNTEETLSNQILDSGLALVHKAHLLTELNNNFTENDKIKTYIKRALKIPHNKSEFDIGADTILKLRQNLDQIVYGHTETKEEIIDFVTSKITNPQNFKAQVLALHGPPGVGKCHGKNTPILMYNGSYKLVQDIVVGDKIMGDDSTPRNVITLGSGMDMLYIVHHTQSGKRYTVNSEHILCLKSPRGDAIEMSVNKFLALNDDIQDEYKGYSTAIQFPEIELDIKPREYFLDVNRQRLPIFYKVNSYKVRLDVLTQAIDKFGFCEDNCAIMLINNLSLTKDITWIIDSLGLLCSQKLINDIYYLKIHNYKEDYRPSDCAEKIQITPIGVGNYYGFTLDGNSRYVIESFVVTHNTRFIRALGKTLNLPFNQISFGGLHDVSTLTGHDYTYIGSKPGKIYNAFTKSKCNNCIIYLDEIDKIASPESEKFIAINGVLTHLLDPEQNGEFHDNYLGDISLDLSNVFFIVSFNNIQNVDPVVLDRLKVIEIKESSVSEKIEIVKKFTLPEACKNVDIDCKNLKIDDDTIRYIILNKTKGDKGMRSINKNIATLISKLNTLLHIERIKPHDRNIIVKGFSYEKINISNYKNGDIVSIDRNLVDLIFKEKEAPLHQHMYI